MISIAFSKDGKPTAASAPTKYPKVKGVGTDKVACLVSLLREHYSVLYKFFEPVINFADIPDLNSDDFPQEILLHVLQHDSTYNWDKCCLDDLLNIGKTILVDKIMMDIRIQFEFDQAKYNLDESELDKLMSQTRTEFLSRDIDPYLVPDWKNELSVLANDILATNSGFAQCRMRELKSTLVVDGKVVSGLTPSSNAADVNAPIKTISNPLKIEILFTSIISGNVSSETKVCLINRVFDFHKKFPDIFDILILRIYQKKSTRIGAKTVNKSEDAFRQLCKYRMEQLLTHLEVCMKDKA